jgi:hypothetical protein
MKGGSMKKIHWLIFISIFVVFAMGCAKDKRYHTSALPDPASFNAHFGDMDTDGDDLVSWQEFKSYFPQATPDIFKTLDRNEDGHVDHDEWHAFKEAHGMREHN